MEEQKRSYYAIIPANVRYDNDLIPSAKLLYGEITALCNERGYCWATNEYFAELYGTSEKTITRWVKNLTDKGYIHTDVQTFRYEDGKVKKVRYIFIDKNVFNQRDKIISNHMDKNVLDQMDIKVPYNNTSFNNTTNNTKERKKKESAYDVIIDELVKDDDIKECIYEFIKMRKLIKKPLTDRALKNIINKLFTLSTNKQEQIEILNNSIDRNWLSVFPLKKENNYGSKRKEIVPDWLNKKVEFEGASDEEINKLKEEMKEFNPELEERIKELKEKLQQ